MPKSPKSHESRLDNKASKQISFHDKNEAQRKYDSLRGSSGQRGYDRKWQKLRKYFREISPLCEICLLNGLTIEMFDVDHIIPISVDRSLRLKISNLQSLCRPCHNAKTMRDRGKGGLNLP